MNIQVINVWSGLKELLELNLKTKYMRAMREDRDRQVIYIVSCKYSAFRLARTSRENEK